MTRDSGQLTFTTMSGATVVEPVRGKHYVEPRGYAAKPGTGPKGETCGTCKHKTYSGRGRRYPKCVLTRTCWGHSRRTDILVKSPACAKWEAEKTA